MQQAESTCACSSSFFERCVDVFVTSNKSERLEEKEETSIDFSSWKKRREKEVHRQAAVVSLLSLSLLLVFLFLFYLSLSSSFLRFSFPPAVKVFVANFFSL